MSRYRTTIAKKVDLSSRYRDRTGRVSKYDTTIHPKIPEKNSDIMVISQPGDRLDNLAFQFYRNPNLWWVIANANGLNSMNVEQGLSMRIPTEINELIVE